MRATSTLPSTPVVASRRRPGRERAHELLLDAATLDLDRAEWRVRCWYGAHANWWRLDEARHLLTLASELWEEDRERGRELVVVDGFDLYRFDVS
jgi:hypothetical protein